MSDYPVFPDWLVPEFENAFLNLWKSRENKASNNERDLYLRLLTSETKQTWQNLEKQLDEKYQWNRQTLASTIVGSFTMPISVGYGQTGTRDRPTWKTKLLDEQKIANNKLLKIKNKAEELASLMDEYDGRFSPDIFSFLSIIEPTLKVLGESPLRQNLPSYYYRKQTSDALRYIADEIDNFLEEDFSNVPGMSSKKSTWRDWLREARANLLDCRIELQEVNWVRLCSSLFGVSRASVHAALREDED